MDKIIVTGILEAVNKGNVSVWGTNIVFVYDYMLLTSILMTTLSIAF